MPATPPAPAVARPRFFAAPDQAQLQRFELKYLVNETMARSMQQFVRCYLRPDEFAAVSPNHAYAVHTLYLDSPDLALYAATGNGDANRFKLRVRFYDDGGDAPVFFEVKRRRNECISKLRARVRRDAVRPLLAGAWPSARHLAKPDVKQEFALREFCRLMRVIDATPRSHVAYQREAWMSPTDNSMRVTFDRQVQCEPQFSAALHAGLSAGDAVAPFEKSVICELKFTNRMPNWCGELIRAFGLVRGGAAKYVEGVARMGEHRVANGTVGLRPPAGAEPVRDHAVEGDTVGAF